MEWRISNYTFCKFYYEFQQIADYSLNNLGMQYSKNNLYF